MVLGLKTLFLLKKRRADKIHMNKNNYDYTFTVFTPTYNRAKTLPAVYESLRLQTFKDFEWLIIDDGSVDQTKKIVAGWQKKAEFPIRYIWQENKGKYVAFSNGVKEAKGEFFINLDSDDSCVSFALEKLKYHWDSIEEEKKKIFSGVVSLGMNSKGDLVGTEFPENIFDSNHLDIYYKYKIKGDKWGFYKTDILKEFLFPINKEERFMPEALILNRIALKYKTRYINEKLLIINYRSNGLSVNSIKTRMDNPNNSVFYYKEFVNMMPVPLKWKIRSLINYSRFSFHAKKEIMEQIKGINHIIMKIILILMIPIGFSFYLKDLKSQN